jgi:glycosyltransferase involved in cell wall biosynthesis
MLKVTLFLPSRIYGGAERQFALLAEFLAKQSEINVTVIDSKVGIITQMIKHVPHIKVKTYANNRKITISDSIIVTPASYMFTVGHMFNIERCDVRFWFLSPLNLPSMYITSKFKSVMALVLRSIFRLIYQKKIKILEKHLYFGDEDPKQVVEEFFDDKLDSNIMGMLIDLSIPKRIKGNGSFKKGTYAWLGRLDKTSKFIAVKRLMYDLKSFPQFTFHIIGNGDGLNLLKSIAKQYDVIDRVIFHGHVEYEKLPDVLNKCQVVFTHGTSIYEGIRCNIPTVVFDFFFKDDGIAEYKYNFYNQRTTLELGTVVVDPYLDVFTTGYTLAEVMKITADKSNRALIVNESYNKAEIIMRNTMKVINQNFKEDTYSVTSSLYCSTFDIIFWNLRNLIKS